jgi:peptidoglycan glycosyltransferase
MSSQTSTGTGRVPPIRRSVLRAALVLGAVYVALAIGLSYWQVLEADNLTSDPGNPLVLAARRNAQPGRILDVRRTVLVDNVQAADGSTIRQYREPSFGSVIGYRSLRFGTAGLERTYDAQLVGLMPPDPLGRLFRKLQPDPYRPQDIVLGIDARLEVKAAQLLGDRRGSIVALEPSTGRVLAMVSSPTYDANTIVDPKTGAAAFRRLQKDPATPLLDRSTQGRYVPGSVFKIVTAIAGLGSRAITPSTVFPEQPAEEKTGFLVQGFTVTDGHHPQTGSEALSLDAATAVSCNIYFAKVGLLVGGAGLAEWAARLGFGSAIPFDLPVAPSLLTSGSGPEGGFRDAVEVANAAYGQAETFVTPLQMALVAAAVANRGVLMEPRLVVELRNRNGEGYPRPPVVWRQVMDPTVAQEVAAAMRYAVESPLGRPYAGAAKVPGVATAGKTGTAQLGGSAQPHSWFIGFAPADNPQVAVAVLVENGGSGATGAAPLAGQLMAYALSLGP